MILKYICAAHPRIFTLSHSRSLVCAPQFRCLIIDCASILLPERESYREQEPMLCKNDCILYRAWVCLFSDAIGKLWNYCKFVFLLMEGKKRVRSSRAVARVERFSAQSTNWKVEHSCTRYLHFYERFFILWARNTTLKHNMPHILKR